MFCCNRRIAKQAEPHGCFLLGVVSRGTHGDESCSGFAGNHRISRQLGGARRLADMPEVRERAIEVLGMLDEGEL